jgi:hypothetical protein
MASGPGPQRLVSARVRRPAGVTLEWRVVPCGVLRDVGRRGPWCGAAGKGRARTRLVGAASVSSRTEGAPCWRRFLLQATKYVGQRPTVSVRERELFYATKLRRTRRSPRSCASRALPASGQGRRLGRVAAHRRGVLGVQVVLGGQPVAHHDRAAHLHLQPVEGDAANGRLLPLAPVRLAQRGAADHVEQPGAL